MKKKISLKERIHSYLINHLWLKYIVDYGVALIMALLSATIFSFGFKTFLSPTDPHMTNIISGGVSGISQIINLIVQIISPNLGVDALNLSYSIAYLICNIPIVYIAFRKIGIRFGIFSLINVLTVTFLTSLHIPFIDEISKFVGGLVETTADGAPYYMQTGLLARALFAGVCTGLSSGIAFKAETSTGGVDVISYYFSIKKSTNVGKYTVALNVIIIIVFTILHIVEASLSKEITMSSLAESISIVFFAVIYQLTVALIIDTINVRNKKIQLQIITSNKDLHKYLLANVPHGATITPAKGAFTGEEKYIINTVISSFEEKRVVSLVKEFDPKSFINVVNLRQVYGRFYIKPIK